MPDFRDAIRRRLARSRLGGAREAEIVEEIASDLELRYDDLTRAGATAESALATVLEELENLQITSRPVVERVAAGSSSKGGFMSGWVHDLKVALRMLRGRPGFAAAVMGMLALGIAGNTAIFSIFDTLLLRPLPFREPGRLIDVNETAPKWNLQFVGVNNQDYFGWRDGNSTLESLAVAQGGGGNLSDGSVVERISIERVTANFLKTFGLSAALGRDFRPEEDAPKGPDLMMISYDLWQTLYHGDPGVVGRVVKLSEVPHTIIGVLPRDVIWPTGIEACTLLHADPNQPSAYSLTGIGRLKPGVSIEQARADLARVHINVKKAHNDTTPTAPILTPLRDRALGNLKTVTRILFTAVALVLLIACVNIAGLMLVRGEGRSREMAVRAALGASRAALIRQLLTESLLLAIAGVAIGVMLGDLGLKGLIAMIPSDVPKWLRFDMDWRFAIFAVAITAAAAVAFGLLPAFAAASADVRGCMQEMGRSTMTRAKGRVLGALAVCEIALAVVLLAGASLVLAAFQKALHVDPGFRPENVLTGGLRLPPAKYAKPEQSYAFYSGLLERIRALPGVKAASFASLIPLTGHTGYFFEAEGSPHGPGEEKPVTLHITALPGYFETMGITFLGGRPFDARDEAPNAPKVAVVNESFVRYYWPGQNAVGKRIRYVSNRPDWFEVVGVTADTKHYGLDQDMKPSVFVPFHVLASNGMFLAVRSSGDPDALVSSVRDAVRQGDPDLPIFDLRTMTSRVDRSLWTRRVYSWLFGTFAAVAVLLAAAGIYGVISFSVSQRTREIGIRMALGARPGQVMMGVLGAGMMLVAIGIILGVVVSEFSSTLIESLLFEISPRAIGTYAIVVAVVALIGAAANLAPARRAARVDPIEALRFD